MIKSKKALIVVRSLDCTGIRKQEILSTILITFFEDYTSTWKTVL